MAQGQGASPVVAGLEIDNPNKEMIPEHVFSEASELVQAAMEHEQFCMDEGDESFVFRDRNVVILKDGYIMFVYVSFDIASPEIINE